MFYVSKGLFESREKARSSIMAGVVFYRETKRQMGVKVDVDSEIVIKENVHPMSAGGLKLEGNKTFHIDLNGKTARDIGASTGASPTVCSRMEPQGLFHRCWLRSTGMGAKER